VWDGDVSIRVTENDDDRWASRGRTSCWGALAAFEPQGLTVAGKTVLDAGASTGGFTDVCLDRGAAEVLAVDVGYGQLIWRLQNDDRVRVMDRTNVRTLTPEQLGGPADLMVGDLSFISIELVLPALAACMRDGGDLLPMVKPQFEVGRDRLGHGGVVRSPELRAEVTADVARAALGHGLSTKAVTASPLPGPSGNVEYFLWLTKDGGESAPTDAELLTMVETAIEEGPQ
jgi:23S rRNA (cytidine1920-2'-O)/16S rRNA (cytidine1409-2'-O)-methyltransferase